MLQFLFLPDLCTHNSTCTFTHTVKPALSDHPTVQEKVVVIDRWSLKQGSWIQADFSKLCWTVANVVERTRTIYVTISHVDLVQAVASCGGSLANLRCGGCFWRECGVKATIFLAFGRLRQGKSGRWCKKSGSLVALGRWSPNTGHFEWQPLRAWKIGR